MDDELRDALRAGGGIIVGRLHPRLRHAIRRDRERGHLRAVLRGIYARTELAGTFSIRVLALATADPDAVLVGRSAAVAHGLAPVREDDPVDAASARLQGDRPGFRLSRRRVPPDHVRTVGGVRVTSRDLTVLDLARTSNPAPLTDHLREGGTLAALTDALRATRKRRGNATLRRWLWVARGAPWSFAEFEAHAALRRRRVHRWRANPRIELPAGPTRHASPDVAFDDLLLAFEIDGYAHHGNRASFEHDRGRDLALTRLGWHVVRVTAAQVLADPDAFAALVVELVAVRRLFVRGRAR